MIDIKEKKNPGFSCAKHEPLKHGSWQTTKCPVLSPKTAKKKQCSRIPVENLELDEKEQLEIQVQCKRQVMREQINVMVRGSVWGFSTCICQPLVHPLGVELPASHLGLIYKQSAGGLLKLGQPATSRQFVMCCSMVMRQLLFWELVYLFPPTLLHLDYYCTKDGNYKNTALGENLECPE